MGVRHIEEKLYNPFWWLGLTVSRLQNYCEETVYCLPGTHLINLGEMKSSISLRATRQFWTKDPWIGNPVSEELSIEMGWNLLHPINTNRQNRVRDNRIISFRVGSHQSSSLTCTQILLVQCYRVQRYSIRWILNIKSLLMDFLFENN